MKKVVKYKSGLTLIYKRHKNSKESVYFEFKFLAGENNDPEDKIGLAHFTEHCLGLSNHKFTKDEKFSLLYEKGYCNLITGSSYIKAYGNVADEQFEDVFSSISNWLTDFDLNEAEVESERNVILQEIKQKRINIDLTMGQCILKALYKNFPHSKLPPYSAAELVEHVESITLQEIKDYIATTFCQKNCQLTVCGNVSLSKVKRIIKRYVLPYMPTGVKPPYKKFGEYAVYRDKPKFLKAASPDGNNSEIYISSIYQLPAEDKLYGYATRLLNINFAHTAFDVFRDKYSLVYTPSAALGVSKRIEQNKYYIYYTLALRCDSKNISKALQVLPEFYYNLKNCLVDSEKLKIIKTNVRCKDKVDVISSNKGCGMNLSDTYFAAGKFASKSELKKLKRRRKRITPEFVNNTLVNAITQKPFIVVVSNTTDELPAYNKLWQDIKKNLKWVEEVNKPGAKTQTTKNTQNK